VTDPSPLESCKSLKRLYLARTKVTPASVAALQKALPKCQIEWDGPAKAVGDNPNQPWDTPAFQQWVKDTQALPAEKQIEAVSKKLMELNPGFDGKMTRTGGEGTPKVVNGIVTQLGFRTDDVTDISPFRALKKLEALDCGGIGQKKNKLSDLSPLSGMRLTSVACVNTQVSDLSQLESLPLINVNCNGTLVSDLSPLRRMHLTTFNCGLTQVSDLSPLAGTPLTSLYCYGTKVSDLSPLMSCASLSTLKVANTKVTPASVAALQAKLPNCNIEWDGPAKSVADKPNPPWNSPEFQAWMKATQALPAEQQIKAVSKKLMESNPGFDGKLTNIHESGPPNVEKGVVTELRFHSLHVTDISPLRAFSKLNALLCYPGGNAGSPLSDLSPLQGAPLAELRFSGTSVFDLSPLEGMPLRTVQCDNTHVSDLSPLEGCKTLKALNVKSTKVTAATVAALRKALPNCKIEWDGAAQASGVGIQDSGKGTASNPKSAIPSP
jgi:Leucine-rich repeat (LRR) protein